MRFAVKVAYAPIGAMAQHIAGAYGIHLRRRWKLKGNLFRHYAAFPIDGEHRLDDLVVWLHSPSAQVHAGHVEGQPYWTADAAYLNPRSMAWVSTARVLEALGRGPSAISRYRQRKMQPLDPAALADVTQRPSRRKSRMPSDESAGGVSDDLPASRLAVEDIAVAVAWYTRVSCADMCSDSRKRTVTRAKMITAVLCTRSGISVSAVARFFNRSRSALIEQVDRYHKEHPQLFEEMQEALIGLFDPKLRYGP